MALASNSKHAKFNISEKELLTHVDINWPFKQHVELE